MKNSLISEKNLIPGKDYWCAYNGHSILYLMKYTDKKSFKWSEEPEDICSVRVLFEGYVNTSKSRIPINYLVPQRHYWCKSRNENALLLMRYEGVKSFYSISDDQLFQLENVKVIFEDYES